MLAHDALKYLYNIDFKFTNYGRDGGLRPVHGLFGSCFVAKEAFADFAE